MLLEHQSGRQCPTCLYRFLLQHKQDKLTVPVLRRMHGPYVPHVKDAAADGRASFFAFNQYHEGDQPLVQSGPTCRALKDTVLKYEADRRTGCLELVIGCNIAIAIQSLKKLSGYAAENPS